MCSSQAANADRGFFGRHSSHCIGKSTEANCEVLKKAHEICVHWARTNGATFVLKKYELLHFTRSPKRSNMKATVDLSEVAVNMAN